MSKDKLFIVKLNYSRFYEETKRWEQEDILEYEAWADTEALAIDLVKDKIKEEIHNNIYLHKVIEENVYLNGFIVTTEQRFEIVKEAYTDFEVINYDGVEWCMVHPSMREYLMSTANVDKDYWNKDTGHCIIDFSNGLSIKGTMKQVNDEWVIEPYVDAELYSPYLDTDSILD